MGEVIRDVDTIDIGKNKLKIELNHSTRERGEYEIHIQDDHFRLAVTEREFLQICSCFVLARKQMYILKGKEDASSLDSSNTALTMLDEEAETDSEVPAPHYIDSAAIRAFFAELNDSDIQYVLIKNVNDELPDRLKNGKDIDILVKETDHQKFDEFMSSHNFRRHTPPKGRAKGWNFAYQLPEYEFWKKEDIDDDLFIDASFKLSCESLTPKTWIPLDRLINDDIWEKRVFDRDNNFWILDDKTQLIYLLCRSIFDKREFKAGYVRGIEERVQYIDDSDVQMELSKVFFKFTPVLTQMVKDKQYGQIIDAYLEFVDY
jgi:hypothetical protein